MTTSSVQSTKKAGNQDDVEYDAYVRAINKTFSERTNGQPLFTTDATGLFDAYLAGFSPEERQYHNCNCCRRFIEKYGGLVTLHDGGVPCPAFWCVDESPEKYENAVINVIRRLGGAKVTGVFLSSGNVYGTPMTGGWSHFYLDSTSVPHKGLLATADQAMAAKREDFNTVSRALAEFDKSTLNAAVTILKSEALYRGEKVLGPAEWLYNLQVESCRTSGNLRRNVVWKAIATAPAGFCHPRSSMIGTLLEDLAAGLGGDDAARKFAAKMNPTQYQRPQAPPSQGTIEQAEKIVEKMGIAKSLDRRFAKIEEVETFWKPTPVKASEQPGGVFGHLKSKPAKVSDISIPTQTWTWEKFARLALPTASRIEMQVPGHGGFYGMLTAADPDAPPILQWDDATRRNPVSWYYYHSGSQASQWKLIPGAWVDVNGICKVPCHWYGKAFSHYAEGIRLILNGAQDARCTHSGLFPEILRSELHGIRSVIEAHARTQKVQGAEEGTANGFGIDKGNANLNVVLRTTSADGTVANYRIDRWD